MNLSDLTTALVLRGFQKKEFSENGFITSPTGGRFWYIQDAHDSLDGNTWLCIHPDDRLLEIGVCVDSSGELIECSISAKAVSPQWIEYHPLPVSVDELLDGCSAAIDLIDRLAGEALLSHGELTRQLQHHLPAGLHVASAQEGTND